MKITAIIQCRMGSTRLPGKVLMDLGGKTVLARVVGRLRRATQVDEIVVATTDSVADDAVVQECRQLEVKYSRGSENDVLDRYYQAAIVSAAGSVVRITSDCPVIDPQLVDETIRDKVKLLWIGECRDELPRWSDRLVNHRLKPSDIKSGITKTRLAELVEFAQLTPTESATQP